MALTVTTPDPLLARRTVDGSDCEPTLVSSKASVAVDSSRLGLGPARPTPVSISTGGKLPVEAICTWALLVPEAPGANWTEMVQLVASNSTAPIAHVPPTTEN